MSFECCWFNPGRDPVDCPNIEEGEEYLYSSPRKRLVEKCLECAGFLRDIASLPQDDPLVGIIAILREECREQKGHLQSLSGFLSSKSREIKFLHEVSTVLQTSVDLDEVLSVAMTAITSGKGFGMNRAFLLMTDRERQNLRGHLGVGPRDYEEAWRIWDEVDRSNFSLAELSRQFKTSKIASERAKFQDVLEQLTVSRSDDRHIFNRCLRERRPLLVEHVRENPEVDDKLRTTLGVDHFLVMPLISRNRSIGILLADNFVTNKPITPRDVQSLETFAFPVAFAIERASLYEKLQEEIGKQVEANRKLQEQQELMVRMEKMAVVGRVTSSIAHSIRNPLTAIGGYARALLKNSENLDRRREYLEYIINEARQLDDVLEEVLNYSDSQHPVQDYWDLNRLAESACQEMAEKLASREIRLEFDLGAELPTAWIDYKQIAYCLRTIINHVVENQPGADLIRVRTVGEADVLKIILADNGVSLPPEVKEAITTPFVVTQELGLGIGLPLCRIILERSGSQFSIEDQPGGGTCYVLAIPRRKEQG
jgi:signal transduction histidine kinase